jgi:hypothetical protein
MDKVRFGIIGDGYIANRHKKAIDHIGGELVAVYDTDNTKPVFHDIEDFFDRNFDYIAICTPSVTHEEYIKMCLHEGIKVIVEKPMVLPSQQWMVDDRINVVLQFRYMNLPEKATDVMVNFVRSEEWFRGWQNNSSITGGLFSHMFIHYIDLASRVNADFYGRIDLESAASAQTRFIKSGKEVILDLQKVDQQRLYNRMYRKIVYENKGVKPLQIIKLNDDIIYLTNHFGTSIDAGRLYYVPKTFYERGV